MLSRRRFFKGSTVLSAAALGFPQVARSAETLHQLKGQRPRHIIHLVSDGTSSGTITCGDYFSEMLRGRGLTWMKLYGQPAVRRALMNMRSLNSMVTDSSAASSSWGSGTRVINGAVNQLPEGQSLTTLYELFASAGWKRGLVTTTEITHATPAGFAANCDDRGSGDTIAAQYLQRRVDVLLGGGQKFFDPAKRKDKRDLKADYRSAGYRVMENAAELMAAPTDQRWLGLFSKSHLPFMVDRIHDQNLVATVPTLATMTGRALEWLGREEHFILQVEGGRVDHGAHNCDAAAALRELVAFDEAIEVCLEFQRRVPDTLIVVTVDHGTGNPGLNGTGTSYSQSSWLFHNLTKVHASIAEILRILKHKPEGDDDEDKTEEEKEREKKNAYLAPVAEIKEVVAALTGYKLSTKRAEAFQPFLNKKGATAYEAMNSDTAQLGQLLGNHLGIGWSSGSHSADFVPLVALGPGSERFEGFLQNVDVFRHYTQLGGIDFRNPTAPLIARGPEAGDVENIREYALA